MSQDKLLNMLAVSFQRILNGLEALILRFLDQIFRAFYLEWKTFSIQKFSVQKMGKLINDGETD